MFEQLVFILHAWQRIAGSVGHQLSCVTAHVLTLLSHWPLFIDFGSWLSQQLHLPSSWSSWLDEWEHHPEGCLGRRVWQEILSSRPAQCWWTGRSHSDFRRDQEGLWCFGRFPLRSRLPHYLYPWRSQPEWPWDSFTQLQDWQDTNTCGNCGRLLHLYMNDSSC